MARQPGPPDDFDAKLRKLGKAAYGGLRKRGVPETEIQKAIAKKAKRKPRGGKSA